MRDFKAGHDINVGGDVYINDQSNQSYKLLAQCTNEELHEERHLRKAVLSKERTHKFKLGAGMWLCAELVVCGVALWQYIYGSKELSSLILSLGSIAVGFIAVKFFEQETEFEKRQGAALQEIQMILRERGAE